MQKKITRFLTIALLLFGLIVISGGCAQQPPATDDTGQDKQQVEAQQPEAQQPEDKELLLATTTSTYDSGLLGVLEPDFEKKTGYDLQILSKGTGASLKLGQNGDVDVLLVHAKDRELQLVEEGYFVNRQDVMYNDFVVLGPETDPAQVKGMTDVVQAFTSIAQAEAEFVSRGDNSGTNMKEKSIWDKTSLDVSGDWYLSVGQGMGDTLRVANEKQAYTLSDRGTYLSMKDKMDLKVLVAGDPLLFNQYGVMAVNPEQYQNTNIDGANAFIEYMVSADTQQKIAAYKKYGEQLFTPNAK